MKRLENESEQDFHARLVDALIDAAKKTPTATNSEALLTARFDLDHELKWLRDNRDRLKKRVLTA